MTRSNAAISHLRRHTHIHNTDICMYMYEHTPMRTGGRRGNKPHLPADGAARSRPAVPKAGGGLTQQEKAAGESPRGAATGAAPRP